jgi:hypothetical protein
MSATNLYPISLLSIIIIMLCRSIKYTKCKEKISNTLELIIFNKESYFTIYLTLVNKYL